jgi:hypothetical protein
VRPFASRQSTCAAVARTLTGVLLALTVVPLQAAERVDGASPSAASSPAGAAQIEDFCDRLPRPAWQALARGEVAGEAVGEERVEFVFGHFSLLIARAQLDAHVAD